MIRNDHELEVTLERIKYFQRQIAQLRQVETNPENYRLSAGGYLAELDGCDDCSSEFRLPAALPYADTVWAAGESQTKSRPSVRSRWQLGRERQPRHAQGPNAYRLG